MDIDEFERKLDAWETQKIAAARKGLGRWDFIYLLLQLTGILLFAAGIVTSIGDDGGVLRTLPTSLALAMLVTFGGALIAVMRCHAWRTKLLDALFSVWVRIRPPEQLPRD